MDPVTFIIGLTPLFLAYYLAALGHGIVEKSGVLDLAIDGAFVLSVGVAYAEAVYTKNNIWLSFLVAGIASMIFGGVLAWLVTKLPVSHGAAGLSLMFLGYGLAPLIGVPARQLQGRTGLQIGVVAINGVLASTYLGIIFVLGILEWLIMNKTKIGAAIRAAGEDPAAAESLGVNVLWVRLISGLVGFFLIGLGGAAFVLIYSPTWSQGFGVGHGWIAFAISLSAGRNALLTWVSASIFAGLITYMPAIQAAYNMPPDVAKMLPFVFAILAMVIFMLTPLKRKLPPPKSLGKIYFREERTV